jgi:hypothetical protein
VFAVNRLAMITQRRAVPILARTSRDLFRRQLAAVVRHATTNKAAKADLVVDLEFPQHEGLWLEAIESVFRGANLEIVTEVMPSVQSVMAKGYGTVSELLGHTAIDNNAEIARKARTIATKVTAINDTTKDNIINSVRRSIAGGLNVSETAAALERDVVPIFGNRALTVARTELNNAWTEGAATAFKASETLTHLSVIGCEAREPNSPQFNGESTCNFPDLPITQLDAFLAVGFHPNHTGTLVPSGFRD